MTDFISESNAQMQTVEISSVLRGSHGIGVTYVERPTKGRILSVNDLYGSWKHLYILPSELKIGTVEVGMYRVEKRTIVMSWSSFGTHIVVINASQKEPIFLEGIMHLLGGELQIGPVFPVLFCLSSYIMPEYLLFMSQNGEWNDIFKNIPLDVWDKIEHKRYDYWNSPFNDVYEALCQYCPTINVPSLQLQKQRIADAQSIEKMYQEQVASKIRKYEQKDWLNEEHIRNCKHRLSSDMMPLHIAVERLVKFFDAAPNGVKLTDVIGNATGQTVKDLLDGMFRSTTDVKDDIVRLTESEKAGESVEEVIVPEFLNKYCNRIANKYDKPFRIEKKGFDCDAYDGYIKIAPKDFIELLNNVVDNAVYHGFVGDRNDNVLEISIEIRGQICRISIANNGEPMSERARKEYFVRGSFAGETGHTGIGGNRVFKICDKAGGEALEPYSKDGFPVVISVEFPFSL